MEGIGYCESVNKGRNVSKRNVDIFKNRLTARLLFSRKGHDKVKTKVDKRISSGEQGNLFVEK